MRTYYAATHLRERFANTGHRARRVHGFETRAARDQFVREYPTRDCVALTRRALTADEIERAQDQVMFAPVEA